VSPGANILWHVDEFVVDPVRRVLLRQGEPVAVTPKALSILFILLEKQGEVVTKQELIQRIWPNTFVTEANLTQNISSLRKALGERASSRRYIVTVPGRGYSFAGQAVPVEVLDDEAAPAPATGAEPEAPRRAGSSSGVRRTVEMEVVPPLPRPVPAQRGRRSLMAPVALGLAVLAAAGVLWLSTRHTQPAPSPAPPLSASSAVGPEAGPAARRSSVAVLGFRNLSGAQEADWLAPALAEMLNTELTAGSKLRVISGENVVRARRSLALPYTDRLASGDMKRLHSFLGADRVVVGAYLALGQREGRRIRLDLRVIKIPEGNTESSLTEMGTEAGLFDLVSRAGAALREALGVTGLTDEEVRAKRALRLASPEAARLYTLGLGRLRSYDPPGARDLLAAAEKADPNSALIHSSLSQAWTSLGDDARSVEEARKALEMSGSLSREDRLAIEAHLQEASQSWSRASEIYRTLWTFFPDDLEYGLHLATSLMMAGRGREAAATLAALRKLPGPAGQDPRIDLLEARVARRLSDVAGQQRAAAAAVAKGRQSGESVMVANAMVLEGDALRVLGRMDEAILRFQEARQIADRAGFQWGVGMALSNLGIALQSRGDLDGAEKALRESLAVAQALGTANGIAAQYYTLGWLHQDRGELDESLKLLQQSGELYRKVGDRMMETRVLNLAAAVQAGQGDITGAQRSTERAVTMSRETGTRANEGQALQNFGLILDLQGDLGEARRYYLQAFQVFRDLGDTGLAASALAAAADVTARQGDLEGARRRFEHALAAKKRAGDSIGVAQILGYLARLAFEAGDLARSRSLTEDQLRAAAASGSRSLATAGLQSLGRVQRAAGDLSAARRSLEEAIRESSALGEHLKATAARLELAEVALAEDSVGAAGATGAAAEAVSLAREAASWYGARGMRGREARALALLAEASLRTGDLLQAREAAGRARAQAEGSEDRELRLAVAMRAARVAAAAGDPAEALQNLTSALADAEKAGLVAAVLEGRLALGEIQTARQDSRGAATLEAVRTAAQARGFRLLERRAAGPAASLRRLG
jgi:DNA-binding winged helix-turn-helix (wHTH) protein/tetratricopeptide (TPR) repeat protein/TolB-like protein